jgi:hypothetical protein
VSDFTVWRHTWWKNWANCAVLVGNSTGLRMSFPVVFHTENCAFHSQNPIVSSCYLLTPWWYHLKALNFPNDEDHITYSFSNTTSYFTFYTLFFFCSHNIMANVASKEQMTALFLLNIVTCTRRHSTDKPDGKPVLCQRTFSSVFCAVFFNTVKLHILTYSVWGTL